jgi:hypothetical protein
MEEMSELNGRESTKDNQPSRGPCRLPALSLICSTRKPGNFSREGRVIEQDISISDRIGNRGRKPWVGGS